jgi:hypothetical protein
VEVQLQVILPRHQKVADAATAEIDKTTAGIDKITGKTTVATAEI